MDNVRESVLWELLTIIITAIIADSVTVDNYYKQYLSLVYQRPIKLSYLNYNKSIIYNNHSPPTLM